MHYCQKDSFLKMLNDNGMVVAYEGEVIKPAVTNTYT
jgi:hypothetical protein